MCSQTPLLERALTHRSFSADHNERLEFLGDSVLNLAVSGLLFEKLSQLPEGDLSRVRANLVKQDTLYQMADRLGWPRACGWAMARSDRAGTSAFHPGGCAGGGDRCGVSGCRVRCGRQRWCGACTVMSNSVPR
jgi:dsRNA-specific ribonuclease